MEVTNKEAIAVFEDMKRGVFPYDARPYCDAAIHALYILDEDKTIPDNATNEIMDIVNNPSKHIKIIKIDGKDTICYSQQFVKLLELLGRIVHSRK